ncbi:MAG: bifunctional uridylyltransferase/uridylyl-removing protein, partial [Serpentinimonas sp.]|nr:bifunctional uridylyltransferase/uridylyl-removing protein [Serpentinimonas sp.]
QHREWIAQVENDLPLTLQQGGPLPAPGKGRLSRRVKSFPILPRVGLEPDEKGQRWLLTVSASDRIGLLYAIARVLAQHQVDVQLAKISTLGERVEDTFLIRGPQLHLMRAQTHLVQDLQAALETD